LYPHTSQKFDDVSVRGAPQSGQGAPIAATTTGGATDDGWILVPHSEQKSDSVD
jgi:hypothetical protein